MMTRLKYVSLHTKFLCSASCVSTGTWKSQGDKKVNRMKKAKDWRVCKGVETGIGVR